MDIGVQSDSSSDSSSSSSSNTSSSEEESESEEEKEEKLFHPVKKIDTLTSKENEVKHHLTESNKLKHDLTTNNHNDHENDYTAKKYTKLLFFSITGWPLKIGVNLFLL